MTQSNDAPPFSQNSQPDLTVATTADQLINPVSTFLISNAASTVDVLPEPLQSSQQRLQIRVPPPMVLLPNEFIETTTARSRQAGGVPIITSGGRKFVSMANLQATMSQMSNKKKGDKK